MFYQIELKESNKIHNEGDTSMRLPPPNKKKVQETFFPSHMSKEIVDTSTKLIRHFQNKITDIPKADSNETSCCPLNQSWRLNKSIFESSMNPQDNESIKLCDSDLSPLSEMIKNKSDTLENNVNSACIQNSIMINLTNFQSLNINNENGTNGETDDKNTIEVSNKQNKIYTGNQVDATMHAFIIREEFDSYCPHYLDQPLTDIEEDYNSEDKESIAINESIDFFKKYEQDKLNKKVLNKDKCSLKDLYNKINLLPTKKLVSTMGNDECLKNNDQIIEDCLVDGGRVIEIYGFSSDLKTVDLITQFRIFNKTYFKIIWVDDTHALGVFESSYLAHCALNTCFALVKTRRLKDAIKASKIKAKETIALLETRPKTCPTIAKRLVRNALGLKTNMSPNILNAGNTLLTNTKEEKMFAIQHKS